MVRIRFIRGSQPNQTGTEVLFCGIPVKRPWGSFSFSMCAHAVVVSLGVSYLHFLAMLPATTIEQVQRARVLDLSSEDIPRLVYRAPKPDPAPGPKELPKHSREAKPTEALAGPSGPPAPARAAREFQMPPVPVTKRAPQTLVQLELPPTLDVRQEQRVPALVMLADTPRRLAPKPFVAPPQRKNTMPIPSHVMLEMRTPILELRPGYAKTPEILSATPPRLAAPVGAVTPVASNREPTEVKPAASTVTGSVPADPANVISLPDRAIPAASAIFLPPLNQASPRDSVSGSAGLMDPAGGKSPTGISGTGEFTGGSTHNATGGAGGPGAGHGAAGANAGGNGAGNSGLGRGPGLAGAGSGAGHTGAGIGGAEGKGGGGGANSGSGTGTAGPGAGGEAGSSLGVAPPPVRLVRPHTGNYEVAVVQSSGVIPGSAGLLKGKPVYSVYIPVGGPKEWILQYCLPADDAHRAEPSQVVTLGNAAPVKAPYAYLIFGPVVQLRFGARFGFIHGFVNASGRFEQLQEASDPVIENLDKVLESLRAWEFRPATKDGVPAVVEVLLCIPSVV